MTAQNFSMRAAAVAIALAWAGTALAGDAGHAWGTMKDPGADLLNSAAMHQAGNNGAEIVAQGPIGTGSTNGGFPAVTSCGTCTTITIQGNNNSISGTSITSTNQGTVTSNGAFNE
jgi:hypothetical protein